MIEVLLSKLVELASIGLVVVRTQSISLEKSLSFISPAICNALTWTRCSWSSIFIKLVSLKEIKEARR